MEQIKDAIRQTASLNENAMQAPVSSACNNKRSYKINERSILISSDQLQMPGAGVANKPISIVKTVASTSSSVFVARRSGKIWGENGEFLKI